MCIRLSASRASSLTALAGVRSRCTASTTTPRHALACSTLGTSASARRHCSAARSTWGLFCLVSVSVSVLMTSTARLGLYSSTPPPEVPPTLQSCPILVSRSARSLQLVLPAEPAATPTAASRSRCSASRHSSLSLDRAEASSGGTSEAEPSRGAAGARTGTLEWGLMRPSLLRMPRLLVEDDDVGAVGASGRSGPAAVAARVACRSEGDSPSTGLVAPSAPTAPGKVDDFLPGLSFSPATIEVAPSSRNVRPASVERKALP